ncbi:MAG TPA: hypothetical protein VMW69_12715 [Spirochaetia bacterium]|nr:hypothetical protein [Spirochaetia bacterium]
MATETRTIIAYEHQRLNLGDELHLEELRRLARFHDRTDDRYYDLCADGIKLKHYVGILSVGSLTIEVLPKTDRAPTHRGAIRWRRALLEMLALAGILRPELLDEASQRADSRGLLYVVIAQFIGQTEELLRHGLVENYRSQKENIPALKGRLLFARHLAANLTRADRWYTDHNVYDRNHPLNGVIRMALDIVDPHCPASLRRRLRAVRREFLEINPFRPDQIFMDLLRYDRRTMRYRETIALAWLILQNLGPDLSAGQRPLLAIMFDMNRLFETTVRELLRGESRKNAQGIKVLPAPRTTFWKGVDLLPDIVIEKDDRRVVVDTKWKTPGEGGVSEHDLRQIFTYGLYFGAARVILLYPRKDNEHAIEAAFEPFQGCPDLQLSCSLAYADLVTADGMLNDQFASGFISFAFGSDVLADLPRHATTL